MAPTPGDESDVEMAARPSLALTAQGCGARARAMPLAYVRFIDQDDSHDA